MFKIVNLLAGSIIIVAILGALLAFPIMWCWNYAVVAVWNLPSITWGQAWCLNFLAGCFLKQTPKAGDN